MHLVTEQMQEVSQHLARVIVVLHHQHPSRRRRRGWPRGVVGVRWRGEDWQPHGERAAASRAGAGRLHRSAVQLDELAHEREPDAEPAGAALERAIALHEQLEHARQQLGTDAHAGVAHGQDRLIAVATHGDGDLAPGRRVLHRVGEEVRQHLLEPCRIRGDPRGRRVHADDVPRAGGAAVQRRHAPGDLGEVDGLQAQHDLAGHHARDVEQIVDDPREVLHLAADDVAGARAGVVAAGRAGQHVGGAADGAERVAQLVAQHREELVLRAVRRFGLGARRLLLAEEPRVLDGDRRLLGEAHADRLVLVGERARRAVADVQEAGHLRPDEHGHDHERHRARLL